jgi:anti-sigma B factor antagonist
MKTWTASVLQLTVERLPVKDKPYRRVLTLDGEIDMDTVAELRLNLRAAQAEGASEIVLDLEKVTFIDSIGLSELADTARRLRTAGGWLRVASQRPNFRRLLDITGLVRFVPIYDDVASALAA